MPRPGPGFEKRVKEPVVTSLEGNVLGSVAVIGAGVSGLAAAYRLKKEGLKVTVFEADSSVGGKIKSSSKDGYVWESGANTMAESEPIVGQLISELQLEDLRLLPNQQNKRYIVRHGKAELVPSNPIAFLGSKLLSTPAKLRILAEPFMWKRRPSKKGGAGAASPETEEEEDESLADFLERHVGREPVDYLADPVCAGTFGSDSRSLSVRHAFPKLWELEQKHGSLFVGAVLSKFSKKDGSPPPKKVSGSFSFLGGMQTLPNALAQRVGKDCLQLGLPVQALACSSSSRQLGSAAKPPSSSPSSPSSLPSSLSSSSSSWTVSLNAKGGSSKKDARFDAVIVTVPMHSLQDVRVTRDGESYPLRLPPVTYQPMTLVINAFKAADVLQPLPGFGVLVPAAEQAKGLKTLGTLFSSAMFWDRAPPGQVLFTTFVGGSRSRSVVAKSPDELQRIALHDIHQLLGVEGPPTFTKQVSWKQAFPEYGKGYGKVLDAIERLERDLPGLYYAGNHRGGLSVGTALASGYDTAGRIIADLQARGGSSLPAVVQLP